MSNHFVDHQELRNMVWKNRLQAFIIFFCNFLILEFFLYFLFGTFGVWLGFIIIPTMMSFGTLASPKMALRVHKAMPLAPQYVPGLFSLIADVSYAAGLKTMPALYFIPTRNFNAFSTGTKENPYLALSEGILTHFTEREIRGIVAHEIAHISQGDLRLTTMSLFFVHFVDVLAGIIQIILLLMLPLILSGKVPFSFLIVFLVLFGPKLVLLLHLKFSRNREFNADWVAIQFTGDPLGLAQALKKVKTEDFRLLKYLFGNYSRRAIPDWLSTHPAIEERIERLMTITLKLPKH